jgi:TrmH family RNA methyltransferase
MNLPPPITSRSNAKVKELRGALSGKASKAGDLLGLEGDHLINEAHRRGLSFETVYLREGSEGLLEADGGWRKELRSAHWAVLIRDVFDGAVSTVAPQGIAATWTIRDLVAAPQSNALIVEGLQDPGNLGTLIRSAAAFGMDRVFVTPDAVNQWNPKVVRAAAGSSFHVPVERLPIEEIAQHLHGEGIRIFAAVAGFACGPEFGQPVMSARHGVLTGRTENALAKPGFGSHSPFANRILAPDEGTPYDASLSYDTDFVQPCAILIGNEGAGLSQKARSLADEQVMIPCNVESLNAAVAGSVLMYAMMSQTTLRLWARKQGLRP